MAHGYVIAQLNITDPDAFKGYMKMVKPTVDIYGGEYLVRGGVCVCQEGTPPGERNVVIKFPTYDVAQEWYNSPEYAPAKAIRMAASNGAMTIVEGV